MTSVFGDPVRLEVMKLTSFLIEFNKQLGKNAAIAAKGVDSQSVLFGNI